MHTIFLHFNCLLLNIALNIFEQKLATCDRVLVQLGWSGNFALLKEELVPSLREVFAKFLSLGLGVLRLVHLHLVWLHYVAQVFVSVSHWHHRALVVGKHQEFTVADFANFAQYLVAILKLYRLWKGAWSHSTVRAVAHRTKLTLNRLFQLLFAGKAIGLLTKHLIARRIILHFKFKDDFLRVESMCGAKHIDGHYLFHFVSLITGQLLELLLNAQVSLLVKHHVVG